MCVCVYVYIYVYMYIHTHTVKLTHCHEHLGHFPFVTVMCIASVNSVVQAGIRECCTRGNPALSSGISFLFIPVSVCCVPVLLSSELSLYGEMLTSSMKSFLVFALDLIQFLLVFGS